jgi:hypothetical protein
VNEAPRYVFFTWISFKVFDELKELWNIGRCLHEMIDKFTLVSLRSNLKYTFSDVHPAKVIDYVSDFFLKSEHLHCTNWFKKVGQKNGVIDTSLLSH